MAAEAVEDEASQDGACKHAQVLGHQGQGQCPHSSPPWGSLGQAEWASPSQQLHTHTHTHTHTHIRVHTRMKGCYIVKNKHLFLINEFLHSCNLPKMQKKHLPPLP